MDGETNGRVQSIKCRERELERKDIAINSIVADAFLFAKLFIFSFSFPQSNLTRVSHLHTYLVGSRPPGHDVIYPKIHAITHFNFYDFYERRIKHRNKYMLCNDRKPCRESFIYTVHLSLFINAVSN